MVQALRDSKSSPRAHNDEQPWLDAHRESHTHLIANLYRYGIEVNVRAVCRLVDAGPQPS